MMALESCSELIWCMTCMRNRKARKQPFSKQQTQGNNDEPLDIEIDAADDDIPQDVPSNLSLRFKKRMNQRDTRNKLMCYPEDKIKSQWEMVVTTTLMIMCISTPIYIAFNDDTKVQESKGDGATSDSTGINWTILNLILDLVFAIDIFVVFSSAHYNDDFQLVDDRWQISIRYLRGWFLIDLLAVFPFEQIIQSTQKNPVDMNDIIRITKFGRLYKLIKLTRMLRMLKVLKQKSNLTKITQELLQLSHSFERIFFFVFSSLLICHICACLWIFFSFFGPDDGSTWIDDIND